MPLFVMDWQGDDKVMAMGPIARGWYMHLLLIQWRHERIPSERSVVRRLLANIPQDILQTDSESEQPWDYEKILNQVLERFEPDSNGGLVNRKLQSIYNQQLAEYQARCKQTEKARLLRWSNRKPTESV